jgi:hypothetical protein
MKLFGYTIPQLKKTLISVAGFIVAVLTAATTGNLIPPRWLPAALGVIGVATTVGVFLARNADVVPVGPGKPGDPGPIPIIKVT